MRTFTLKAGTSRRSHHGFTLIELMIVVAIITILASIAIPNYIEQTRKARRAEAKTALLQAISRAEKYFLNNSSYPTGASPGTTALAAMNIPTTTENGYYQIRYSYDGGTITEDNPRFQAIAQAGGAQADDNECRTYQISMTDLRSAFGSDSSDNTIECW